MSISGERIKACRILNKLTQEDVAKHLGIGKQAVYKYETGMVTNIPLENLEKIAELLNTTPGYLAGWSDVGAPAPLFSDDELHLIDNYRQLIPKGKRLLQERSEELILLYGEKSKDHSLDQTG